MNLIKKVFAMSHTGSITIMGLALLWATNVFAAAPDIDPDGAPRGGRIASEPALPAVSQKTGYRREVLPQTLKSGDGTGGGDLRDRPIPNPILNTVSGTVSLPPGVTAPAGGTTIRIRVRQHTSGGDILGGDSENVVIAAGDATAPFSIDIGSSPSAVGLVSYTCSTGCRGETGLVGRGYYRKSGTVVREERAQPLAGG